MGSTSEGGWFTSLLLRKLATRLDGGDSCIGFRSAERLQLESGRQPIAYSLLEVTGSEMSLKITSWAFRCRGDFFVAGQCIHCDPELPGRPNTYECGTVELSLTDDLFVEVTLAQHEEVTGGVVVGGGITGDSGVAERKDVSLTVDSDVIGDVDPALLVLMKSLMLLQPSDDPAVVRQCYG